MSTVSTVLWDDGCSARSENFFTALTGLLAGTGHSVGMVSTLTPLHMCSSALCPQSAACHLCSHWYTHSTLCSRSSTAFIVFDTMDFSPDSIESKFSCECTLDHSLAASLVHRVNVYNGCECMRVCFMLDMHIFVYDQGVRLGEHLWTSWRPSKVDNKETSLVHYEHLQILALLTSPV